MTQNELTRLWVQYLKNNAIVSSAPASGGRLTYFRRPTNVDLTKFISRNTDLSDRKISIIINRAIEQVKAVERTPAPKDLSTDIWNDNTRVDETDILDTSFEVSDAVIRRVFAAVIEAIDAMDESSYTEALDQVFSIIKNEMSEKQRDKLWRMING